MTKAILSLITAITASLIMVGAVYAAFTTNATIGPQTFQAGYIGLGNTSGAWQESWYTDDNLSPGDTLSYLVTLSNTGNVPMQITTATSNIEGDLEPVITTGVETPQNGWSILQPGETQEARVWTTMDGDASNEYMNQTGNITATFNAESRAH